jgi:hypothetical protein
MSVHAPGCNFRDINRIDDTPDTCGRHLFP